MATAVFALLVAWHALGFSYLPLDVPLVSSSDAAQAQFLIEASREDGRYQPISRAGAPFGTRYTDLPNADGFGLFLTRLIGITTDSPAAVYNLLVLGGFLLTALIAFVVYRRLGLTAPWAAIASLAFTWLPFHFQRLGQPFTMLYFSAALAGWLALEVISGSARISDRPRIWRGIVILAAVLCGMSGTSYAFFTCLIAIAAGLFAAANTRSWLPVRRAALVTAIVIAATVVNFAPAWWQMHKAGGNLELTTPSAAESETYGLKLTQLVLPRQAHRSESLAEFRARYDQSAPLSNENSTASLGLIGAIGFLLLLTVPFLGRWREQLPALVRDSAAPTYLAFLYATVGGGASLFAWLVAPQLYTPNRISPFIAFFAILVSCVLLAAWANRPKSRFAAWRAILVPLLVLGICIYDQISAGGSDWIPVHQAQAAKHEQDQKFYRSIEQALPKASMIALLPLTSFPPDPAQPFPAAFNPFEAYLQTKHLRWTSGAMLGRPEQRWQQLLEAFPLSAQVEALTAVGFAGITVDRRGYADNGASVEAGLAAAKLKSSLQSEDATRSFYPIDKTKNPRFRAYAVVPDRGWSAIESNLGDVWLWSSGNATLLLANESGNARECYLQLSLESFAQARNVSLYEGSTLLATLDLSPGVATELAVYLDPAEGQRRLDLKADKPGTSPGEADPRLLAFRMIMQKPPLCR